MLGLNVGNGNLVIDSAGNISMKGDITMTNGSISWDKVNTDPVASGAAQTAAGAVQGAAAAYGMASAANTAAVNAETIARQIAAGEFAASGTTFIDHRKIYSPEIYANTFTVVPSTTGNTTGGFEIMGYWGTNPTPLPVFQLYYYASSSAPYINFTSGDLGAYANWLFPSTSFSRAVSFSGTNSSVSFSGKVSFAGATVTGLNNVAVFA
ncbi:MAG: hypothetical protein LBK23_10440 [Oscillospiraceae bacterium]|nr:hypothetical protein [Oscillospiraceae bacterium]